MKTILPLRDTAEAYGLVTRLLHWIIAALILWQFLGMGLKLILGRQPVVGFFVKLHQPVGTAIFILILLRVVWALLNLNNRPNHGRGIIGMAATVGHLLLYLLMLLIPGAALLRAYGSDRPFAPFGFGIFPAQQPEITWMVGVADRLHGEMAWLLGLLILGHVVMVGVHEAMWKDGTFARMTGRRRDGANNR